MADVKTVVPNILVIPETETMVGLMGKNIVAYLQNYLVDNINGKG